MEVFRENLEEKLKNVPGLHYSSLEIIQIYFLNNCNLRRTSEKLNVSYQKLRKEFSKLLKEKQHLRKLIKLKKKKNKGFINKRNLEKDRKFITYFIANYGHFTRTAEELNITHQAISQKIEILYIRFPALKKIIDNFHEKGIVKLNGEFVSNKKIIATYLENYSNLKKTARILKITEAYIKKKLNILYEKYPKLKKTAELGKKTIIINKQGKRKYFSDEQIINAYKSTNGYLIKASESLGIEVYTNYQTRLKAIFREDQLLEKIIKKEIEQNRTETKPFERIYSDDEMLTAFYEADGKYEEAARKLGCTGNAVSRRIKEIKKRSYGLIIKIDRILKNKTRRRK